jgi:hypothetical protein
VSLNADGNIVHPVFIALAQRAMMAPVDGFAQVE